MGAKCPECLEAGIPGREVEDCSKDLDIGKSNHRKVNISHGKGNQAIDNSDLSTGTSQLCQTQGFTIGVGDDLDITERKAQDKGSKRSHKHQSPDSDDYAQDGCHLIGEDRAVSQEVADGKIPFKLESNVKCQL